MEHNGNPFNWRINFLCLSCRYISVFLCFCLCMSLCMSERMTGYVTVCSMQSFTVSDPAGKMQISDKTMRHTAAGVLCKEWEPPFQHKAVGLEKDFMEKKNQPISCLLKISQFWKLIDNFKYFFFSCNLLTSEDYNSPSVMSAIDKPVVCENELFPWCLFWILLSESSVFCTSRAPCSLFVIHPENSTFSPRQKVCS